MRATNELVRSAAWAAMAGRAPSAQEVAALARAAAQGEVGERDVARQSLQTLSSGNVVGTLISLCDSDAALRAECLRALGERRERSASPVLLKYMVETGPVRSAALRALGELSDPGTLEPLLSLAADSAPDGAAEIVHVLQGMFQSRPALDEKVPQLVRQIRGYNETQKSRALPLLATWATADAMSLAVDAARSPQPALRQAGLSTLGDWPDSRPVADLLEISRAEEQPTQRALALRAAIKLSSHESNPARKLALLQDAFALGRPQEKRAALSALREVPSAETLAFVRKQFSNPEITEEACEAAIAIAEKLSPAHSDSAETVRAVLNLSKAESTLNRAKQLLPAGKP